MFALAELCCITECWRGDAPEVQYYMYQRQGCVNAPCVCVLVCVCVYTRFIDTVQLSIEQYCTVR